MASPPFGGQKSVDFRGKGELYAARMPRRGKPIGDGLSADCGKRKHGIFNFFCDNKNRLGTKNAIGF